MSGIWLGIATIAGITVGLPAVVVAIVLGSIHWTFRAWRAPLAIALIVAASLGAYRHDARPQPGDRDVLARAAAFRGVVSEWPKMRGGSQAFVLAVTSARIGDDWVAANGTLAVTTSIRPRLFKGDEISFAGDVKRFEHLLGEEKGYVRSLRGDGVVFAPSVKIDRPGSGIAYQIQRVAAGISERLQQAVPGDAGILLSGLVMGDDTRLSPVRRSAFINTGTTHITAVSGSNFALIVVMLSWAGRASGTRRRLWFLIVAVAVLWVYAALVGFGPPAVRAAAVASAALIGVRFGRRADFVTLIVLAGALDVLIRPGDIFRLSFQLSTASALALALVLAGRDIQGLSDSLAAAVLATFAAQLATLPFLLPIFPRLSFASIPANAIIAVPTSLAFVLAVGASVLLPVWPQGGEAIATAAGFCGRAVMTIVDAFGSPGMTKQLPLDGTTGVVWLTVCCFAAIGLMSADIRTGVSAIRRGLIVADRTVALAVAGAIAGGLIGLLAWSLY